MEAGLMEIVRSVSRSSIYDSYFSNIDLFIRGEYPGELSEYPKQNILNNELILKRSIQPFNAKPNHKPTLIVPYDSETLWTIHRVCHSPGRRSWLRGITTTGQGTFWSTTIRLRVSYGK